MGFGADQLRAKALPALEEAIQDVRYGRVRRSIALRFALAYLWTESRGEREPFDCLWNALASPDQLHRFGYADQALAGVYRAVGVVRDDELSMRMWKRAQERYAPRDKNGVLLLRGREED